MRLPLAYYGDSVLRKKCLEVKEIGEELRTIVQNMVDTMQAENGIGLAASQVHLLLRVFITCVPKQTPDGSYHPGTLKVFINPEILEISQETLTISDGCLSIPGLRGRVSRPYKIKVKAINLEGQEFIEELAGLEAFCFLHENDHINGVLFIDRIKGQERKALEPKLREIKQEFAKKRKS